jgi:hypothetical protein
MSVSDCPRLFSIAYQYCPVNLRGLGQKGNGGAAFRVTWGVSDLNRKWPFAMATSKAGTAVLDHGRRWCIGVRTSRDGQIAAPVVVDRMIAVHRVHRPTINDNIRTKPVQLDEPLREVVAVLAQAQQNLLSPPRHDST